MAIIAEELHTGIIYSLDLILSNKSTHVCGWAGLDTTSYRHTHNVHVLLMFSYIYMGQCLLSNEVE